MGEPLLETVNVSKAFDGLVVVDSVSLQVGSGEVRVMIGPNGAGKTTLFNLISGALNLDGGSVYLKGYDISRLRPEQRARRGLARSFQITNLFPDLSVAETVALCVNAHLRGAWSPFALPLKDAGVREKVERACEIVGLEDAMDVTVTHLSQADQRLLEIATVVSTEPLVMLLDEPTQGVGAREVERFEALIAELKSLAGILVIEHNMECVLEIADVVTVLVNGAIMAEGSPSDIMGNADVQSVYLGTACYGTAD
jgi:branched-chain amino acid transport system ATP-binding protein